MAPSHRRETDLKRSWKSRKGIEDVELHRDRSADVKSYRNDIFQFSSITLLKVNEEEYRMYL
jgi:hypothetical protein